MHYAKHVLILLGLAFASTSHAQIRAYQCNGCSDAQFEQVAANVGLGRHYLYDFQSNDFRRYSVSDSPHPYVQGTSTSATVMQRQGGPVLVARIPVPPAIQASFDATRNLWVLHNNRLGFIKVPVTLDPANPGLPWQLRDSSAWSIALMPNRQYLLEQYLIDHYIDVDQHMTSRWAAVEKAVADLVHNFLTGRLAGLVFGSDPLSVTFVVTMPYGGTVRITYDSTHDSNLWYREGESRDASGNPIPEQPSDMLWNEYGFHGDPGAFHQWSNNPWGVPWPINFCTVVTCVKYPAGPSALKPMQGGNGDLPSPMVRQTIVRCECAAM